MKLLFQIFQNFAIQSVNVKKNTQIIQQGGQILYEPDIRKHLEGKRRK